jgi:hypothetical protein
MEMRISTAPEVGVEEIAAVADAEVLEDIVVKGEVRK